MTDNKNNRANFDSNADPFLTERELAARHRRSPKTLRNNRVNRVYILSHKFVGQVRYQLSVVTDYELKHRVPCADPKLGDCVAPLGDLSAEAFLTPRELAKRHQRGEKTLRNDRLQRRYISFYKLGGQIRYGLSDILAYERAHRAM